MTDRYNVTNATVRFRDENGEWHDLGGAVTAVDLEETPKEVEPVRVIVACGMAYGKSRVIRDLLTAGLSAEVVFVTMMEPKEVQRKTYSLGIIDDMVPQFAGAIKSKRARVPSGKGKRAHKAFNRKLGGGW